MKSLPYITVLLLFLNVGFGINSQAQPTEKIEQPVEYVNPYIGNISHLLVPTYPKVHLPNSYLRVNPERSDHTDVTMEGLPLISKRESSLAFRLSPYQGNRQGLQPIITYRYDNEEVTPYSYSVILDNQETTVNFGTSHQSAMYQLDFQGDDSPFLVLTSQKGNLEWDGEGLSGYQSIGNGTKVYMYMVSDEAPVAHFIMEEDKRGGNKSQAKGDNVSMVLQYPRETKEVGLRYGISFISTDQAQKNMEREIGDKGIATLQDEARKVWNNALGKITVEGGTNDDKAVFYTALYRSYNRPVSISEDDRYYSGDDGQVHDDEIPLYTEDAGGWNTYNSLRPLNILIQPEREENILSSYLRMAEQLDSFRLPIATGFIGDHAAMLNKHIIKSFLDAYSKGLDVDLEKAFEAGKNVVMQKTLAPVSYDSAGFLNRFYQDSGYVPALWPAQKETVPEVRYFQKRMSIATTLGMAYDDWALALMAREVDREEDFQQFCKRSFNYRKLFNTETGFFHPKDSEGRLIQPIDYTYSGGLHGRDYYDESNGWIYRFRLQYNIPDAINMMGGRSAFSENLDSLFSKPFGLSRPRQLYRYHNQTGIVGHFSMGNEPSFHIPYLYNYVGQPWKTQKRIRMLMKQWFRNNLRGIPGDEDWGPLSAYAVFSYMGFYPVSPGLPIYNIGSPVFDSIAIQLSEDKEFKIVAKNNSPENKYIQSATLNGAPLDKPWFRHSDITGGGKLVLQMGPRPNKQWGSDPANAPPSMPLPIKACEEL